MATDLEKLVVQLSADIKGYQREIQKASDITGKQARAIENRWRKANKNLDGIGASMARSLMTPLAGLGAAIGAKEIADLATRWTDLNSRVKLAAGGMEAGADVMTRISEMARRTYSDVEQTAEGYLLNATSMRELGYTTNETLDFVESLNNALVVSGAKGQRSATVMDAISKAMAFGSLQGQNLNTVVQQGGRVAEALAQGLGVTTNELRKLGAEGKITTSAMISALSSQMKQLRKEAEDMPATISDGFLLLKNAMLEYVGNADKATGISEKVAQALIVIADNFDKTADAGLKLAAIIATALAGRSIGGLIDNLGKGSIALVGFIRAVQAARTMAGLSLAIRGLGAAAGPVGLVIGGALAGAVALYTTATADASAGSKEYALALKQVKDAAEKTGPAVEDAAQKTAAAATQAYVADAARAKKQMTALADDAIRLIDQTLETQGRWNPALDEQVKKLRDLYVKYKEGKVPAEDLKRAIDNIITAEGINKFADLARGLGSVIGKLKEAADVADKVTTNRIEKGFEPVREAFAQEERQRKARQDAKEFIDDMTARNALTREQLALQEKIEAIKKRDPRAANLTSGELEKAARDEIAAEKKRAGEGQRLSRDAASRNAQDLQAIRDRTAALAEEMQLVGLDTNEQEKRRIALELQQQALKRLREEARQKGEKDLESIQLSVTQKQEIEAVAEAYGKQAEALEVVREKQQRAEQMAAEFYDTMKSGFADAVTGAKTLEEALQGVLKRLGDLLINSAFDALFKPAGSGAGGLLGSLLGFSEGGYTGPGGKYQPKGVVHGGEVVWSQKDVSRAGGVGVVEALRKGFPGFADGGPVAPRFTAPTLPRITGPSIAGQGVALTYAPQIDARGADVTAIARLEKVLAKDRAEFESRTIAVVQSARGRRAL